MGRELWVVEYRRATREWLPDSGDCWKLASQAHDSIALGWKFPGVSYRVVRYVPAEEEEE